MKNRDDIIIAGIGQVPVGEHWELSLRNLAARAMLAAFKNCGELKPQAIYAGSYLASVASGQANLGALMAECVGLSGVEAFTTEAGEASGAAALHLAVQAIQSGYVETVLVVGVEKFTDVVGSEMEAFISQSADSDFEGMQGLSMTGVAGLVMQRYLHEYGVPRPALSAFPIVAHANAVNNPYAYFRRAISEEDYQRAGLVCDPLNLLDVAPYADGAAAVVITRRAALPKTFHQRVVKVAASNLLTDSLSLHDRQNLIGFDAARLSAQYAYEKTGMTPEIIDLFEYWDAYSIYAALELEAAGFAQSGEGWKLGQDGSLGLRGRIPVATLGGLKARGFPLGATGLYQVADAVTQLRGEAGENQVQGARVALVQALGGAAATAVTHILESE